mgnify:CR=1 FL=1
MNFICWLVNHCQKLKNMMVFHSLDNGIGLTRNFIEQWKETKINPNNYQKPLNLDIICGKSAGKVIKKFS